MNTLETLHSPGTDVLQAVSQSRTGEFSVFGCVPRSHVCFSQPVDLEVTF